MDAASLNSVLTFLDQAALAIFAVCLAVSMIGTVIFTIVSIYRAFGPVDMTGRTKD